MTATAPQPGPPRSRSEARAAQGPAQPTQGQAQVPQRQGHPAQPGHSAAAGTAGAMATPPARRRFDTRSTPSRLRLARGAAAAACLVPGIVGMVEIASAATAPVSSPTQTYAELRAGAATYEAKAATAAARSGASTTEADQALTRVSTQLGAAALLYPDRATELYRVADQLAARQSQLSTAAAGTNASTAAVPAPAADMTSALTKLENAPAARSVVNAQHILIAGSLGVVGLLGASVWLASKSKRVVNPGLVAGMLLTGGVTALGFLVLATTGTSSAVDDIARLRSDAAQSVAAEAASLYAGTPDGTAIQARAKGYVDAGGDLVNRATATSNWAESATPEWTAFQAGELTAAKLGGGDIATRQGLVAARLADLKTLDASLATLARTHGAGADQRPNALAGYGIFALSLLAGAAAWTGVGRRVSEYR